VHCKSRARPLDGRANAAAWISLTTAQTVVILWHDIFYEYTGSGLGGPNVRDHWEDLGVDERIILNGPYGDRNRWGELDSAGSG
jgi:hypothetical protein